MANKWVATTLAALLCVLKISTTDAQCSLPYPFPEDCDCTETVLTGTTIFCFPNDLTNFQELFGNILEAGGADTEFEKLILQFTEITQPMKIPAQVMPSGLRFEAIEIILVPETLGIEIHEDAFPSTYGFTTSLEFVNVWFVDYYNPFTFIREFTKLRSVNFRDGDLIVIPDLAFENMESLEYISITSNRVKEIGIKPFSSLPFLTSLDLNFNNFTDDSFDLFSFDGIEPDTTVTLVGNTQLTHLREDVFKVLLDATHMTVSVGLESDTEENHHLICDERSDWICQDVGNYERKLKGFNCTGTEFTDVFEYCRGKESSGVTNNANIILLVIAILSVLSFVS